MIPALFLGFRIGYWRPKGVIHLPSTGYIRVHAFTSDAQIPLKDVAVSVTDPNGNPIALRLTDRSGFIEPVAITVPDRSASQTPDTGVVPSPVSTSTQGWKITSRSKQKMCRCSPEPSPPRILP